MARRSIPPKLRFEIFKRDAFTCQYCKANGDGVVLHVDHIIPVAEGGDNTIFNLVTACSDCNLGKGKHPLSPDATKEKTVKQLAISQEADAWAKSLAKAKLSSDYQCAEAPAVWEAIEARLRVTLSNYGKSKVAKTVKRMGVEEYMECLRLAIERYEDDGLDHILSKLNGIHKHREEERKRPGIAEVYMVCYGARHKTSRSWVGFEDSVMLLYRMKQMGWAWNDILNELLSCYKRWNDIAVGISQMMPEDAE